MSETVFVTGASGFIARHIVLQLLTQGMHVTGSVRSAEKAESVRSTMARKLGEPVGEDRLSFVKLDLMRDEGWSEAMKGAEVLVHTASPFPISQPRDENDLVHPAVGGTLRALEAARDAGINRVVLTSSVVAIVYGDPLPDKAILTEANWTAPDGPATTAYAKSKTLAELAAWEFVKAHPEIQLTVINPGLVVGPPLDEDFGSSIRVIERFLKGRDPAVPNLRSDIVDVRDIAKMHVEALSNPATVGERIIGVSGPMWFAEIADTLKEVFPDRRIPSRIAPNWLLRLAALYDGGVRSILPQLGKSFTCSNTKAKRLLSMEFVSPEEAILAAAQFLIDEGHVRSKK